MNAMNAMNASHLYYGRKSIFGSVRAFLFYEYFYFLIFLNRVNKIDLVKIHEKVHRAAYSFRFEIFD